MVRKLSGEHRAVLERAAVPQVSGPDFSKLKCEQPLPEPDAFQRAKADDDARAPFKDPRSDGDNRRWRLMPKGSRGQNHPGNLNGAPVQDGRDAEREPALAFYARLAAESGTDIDLETAINDSRREHSGPEL